MPKDSRLSRADFKQMRGFKRLQGRFFSLSYGNIPGRGVAGGAIVVSAKVVGSAAKRNLVKRRVRAILAEAVSEMRNGAYVVYAKKGSSTITFAEAKTDIIDLLARANPSR